MGLDIADRRLALQERLKATRALATKSKADTTQLTPEAEKLSVPLFTQAPPEHHHEESTTTSSQISTRQVPDILGDTRDFQLDSSQLQAIGRLAAEERGVLTGAAGTGKTTCLQHLVHRIIHGNPEVQIGPLIPKWIDAGMYHANNSAKSNGMMIPAIAFCAFTGQATQVMKRRLPPEWHPNVMTVHSLLAYKPVIYDREDGSEGRRFEASYLKNNKFPWQVIVIDEISMLPRKLWDEIVAASLAGIRYYFIGDFNQLAPITDKRGVLIDSLMQFPSVELNVIHRQKDDALNKIVKAAHRVLKGKVPEWDDPKDPNWRVLGVELKSDPSEAHTQVCAIAKQLSIYELQDGPSKGEIVYVPFRDRIITPTNGFNEHAMKSMLGQSMINESLAQVFAGNYPRVIISFDIGTKLFGIGNRVMATVNESPSIRDRVTNGLSGIIEAIEVNGKWAGDRDHVGPEKEVYARRDSLNARGALPLQERGESLKVDAKEFLAGAEDIVIDKDEPVTKLAGPASHIVTVRFDTGAVRSYSRCAEIQQLILAYASTTHKTQGAEMPTTIIILHHSSRQMMNRENFYTAITRATSHVIVLYTPMGLRYSLNKQQFLGDTLEEKIVHLAKKKAKSGGTGRDLLQMQTKESSDAEE